MKLKTLLLTLFISFLSFGQISFTSSNLITFTEAPRDLAAGNFISGGNKELVVAIPSAYGGSSTTNANVKLISLANGGIISSSNLSYNGTNPLSIESGDFDGDGYQDVIFSGNCNCSYAGLLKGSAIGLAQATTSLSYSRFTNDISSGYILNNQKTSLASGGNGGIQVNTATGAVNTLSFSTFYNGLHNSGNGSTGFAVGDMNGDGLGDVLVAHPVEGRIRIYYAQNTSPYFTTVSANAAAPTSFVDSVSVSSSGLSDNVLGVSTGDINGDGILEFAAVIKPTTSASRAVVVFQKISGVYTLVHTINIGDYAQGYGLKFADMNGDGKSDIITADGSVKIFLAGANGAFSSTPSNTLNAFAGQDRVEISDFNGDGLNDVASIGGALKQVVIYLQGLPPTITTQPSTAAQNLCLNATPTDLTITASNATSYQWSSANSSNGTYTDISGATSITFTPPTNVAGVFFYKCRAINAVGSILSNASGARTIDGITINPTTTAINLCYSNSAQALTLTTTATTPSYQWQQSSTSNGTFINVTTGSGGMSSTFTPAHSSIGYGNTMYYKCVVTSTCGTATSNVSGAYLIYSDLIATSFPSPDDQTYCNGASATPLTVNYASTTNWASLTYLWSESTNLTNWTSPAIGTGSTTTSFTPSTAINGTKYYRCMVSGTCGSTMSVPVSGAIAVSPGLNTWNGSSSNDPTNTSNWTTCGSGTNVYIPASVPNFPVYSNLTVASGQTVTVASGAQLTVNGTLSNDGTLIIQSNATLVQGSNSTTSGSGNYIVKQTVSGIGNFTAPSGRFWYMGSPIAAASSSVFFNSQTNSATIVKKRSETTNAWVQITSAAPENLEVGRGYYAQIRPSASSTISQNIPLTFDGSVNNNPTSNGLTVNLTRTANSFAGYNLVSNPYPSYLDWDLVTKNNVGNTMWYRTATGSASNTMVFETYVSGAAGGIGTNLSGNTATKLVPPMQAFWVRVNSGSTTGSIVLDNSMRSHFASFGSSTAGLRSTNDELKMFLRMNLMQEDDKDQIIVYVNGNSSNEFDAFDGEKMMQVDRPQFYTTTSSGKKIVINGLSDVNTQESLPITMELTTTGDHQFMVEDLQVEAGNVWLEDKQLGTFQLLEQGFGYKFFAYSGVNDDRFVLHLKLKDALTPNGPSYDSSDELLSFSSNVYTEGAGTIVIKLPTTDDVATDVKIYDASGRVFYTGTLKSLETKVQLEQAKGIYYVALSSSNGMEVRKVFIQ